MATLVLSINLCACWTPWQHLPPHTSPPPAYSSLQLGNLCPASNWTTSHVKSLTWRRDSFHCAPSKSTQLLCFKITPTWQLSSACKPPCNLTTAAGAGLCGEISWEGQTLLILPHPPSFSPLSSQYHCSFVQPVYQSLLLCVCVQVLLQSQICVCSLLCVWLKVSAAESSFTRKKKKSR